MGGDWVMIGKDVYWTQKFKSDRNIGIGKDMVELKVCWIVP